MVISGLSQDEEGKVAKPLGCFSDWGPRPQAHPMLADGSRLLREHRAHPRGLEPFPGRAFSSVSFCGQTEAEGLFYIKDVGFWGVGWAESSSQRP